MLKRSIHVDGHSIFTAFKNHDMSPQYKSEDFLAPFGDKNLPSVTFYLGLLNPSKNYEDQEEREDYTNKVAGQSSFITFLRSQGYSINTVPFKGPKTMIQVPLTMNVVQDINDGYDCVAIATTKPEYIPLFDNYSRSTQLVLATIPSECDKQLMNKAQHILDIKEGKFVKGSLDLENYEDVDGYGE